MAPPPGRVIATDVEDWHTTAAWPRVSPGMAATSIGQYVTMFQADRAIRISSSVQERDRTITHTRSRSEIRGRTPMNAAPTTTSAIPAWISLASLRRRSSRSGVGSLEVGTKASSCPVPCRIAQG
jgi:hypothetical protein